MQIDVSPQRDGRPVMRRDGSEIETPRKSLNRFWPYKGKTQDNLKESNVAHGYDVESSARDSLNLFHDVKREEDKWVKVAKKNLKKWNRLRIV